MQIDVIETTGLGNRIYLIGAAGVGVVINPQRDIDRVLALAEKRAGFPSPRTKATHQ